MINYAHVIVDLQAGDTGMRLYNNDKLLSFNNTEDFKSYVIDNIKTNCPLVNNIIFSMTPFDI